MRYLQATIMFFLITMEIGCQQGFAPEDLRSDAPEKVARKVMNWRTSVSTGVYNDVAAFYVAHRKDIEDTFEVTDTVTIGSRGAVFIRYSIKSAIFREVIWVRRVDGLWILSYDTITDYQRDSDEPEYKLAKKVKAWTENSAGMWDE